MRFWTPDDIYDVICPHCRREIEFWKDDPTRPCDQCGKDVPNPKIDTGCAEWCAFADQCLNARLRPAGDLTDSC